MTNLYERDKPFIKKGPQQLRQHLQGTECSLFLNVIDGNQVSLFRVNHDMYPGNYNICDLPEIPSNDPELQRARLKSNKLGSFDVIASSIVYDEAI